jgi:hypothetical protein
MNRNIEAKKGAIPGFTHYQERLRAPNSLPHYPFQRIALCQLLKNTRGDL